MGLITLNCAVSKRSYFVIRLIKTSVLEIYGK